MRLKSKLVLLLSLLSIGVLAAALGLLYYLEERHIYEWIEERQMDALAGAAQTLQSLASQGESARSDYLRKLWTSPQRLIDRIVLLDENGRILFHSDFLQGDFSLKNAPATEEPLRAAIGAPGLWRQSVVKNGKKFYFLSTMFDSRGRPWTLVFVYSDETLSRFVWATQRDTWIRFLQVSLLGIGLSVLFASFLSRILTRPIKALGLGARKIGSGELGYRIPAEGKDELGDLAREFNAMGQKLAELDELKDEFISMVSHDLRGPLASIKMHLDYLLSETRGGINAEQAEMLKICTDSAASLSLFINNILNTAKIKAGKMEYLLAPFSLADAVAPVLKLMQMEAGHKKITITASGLDQAPALLGDIDKIEHVFANLLFNALKYTPPGGRIWVQWQMDSSPEKVRVTVGNTGEGIPPENIPDLFSRFYQVDAKKQKDMRIRGTGLGLALVKQTLEAHQGRVWVESKAGQGVQFLFTLPLAAETGSGEEEHRHGQESPYR